MRRNIVFKVLVALTFVTSAYTHAFFSEKLVSLKQKTKSAFSEVSSRDVVIYAIGVTLVVSNLLLMKIIYDMNAKTSSFLDRVIPHSRGTVTNIYEKLASLVERVEALENPGERL